MTAPSFRTEFDPRYGEAVDVTPAGCPVPIQRVVVENPSPFTFHGTNSYIVGRGSLCVIDPGPRDERHLDALLRAIDGRPVSHIAVTHTHVDHSPLTADLKAATGATVVAEGPHRPARALRIGEINPLDASGDTDFTPDRLLVDRDVVDGNGWRLRAIFTPGHTANHMAFALEDAAGGATDVIFSGDHVMAWSTSIVAPPDGSMSDYMASLERIGAEPHPIYMPGHGGRLENAPAFVRALRAHRRMRETAVLDQVRKGRHTVPDMVAVIYANTDPRLHGAASLSVLAHLEDLVARGLVKADGSVSLDASYDAV